MSETSPLATVVIEEIVGQIERGILAPGRSLPSERKLADRFEVSRLIIRTALRQMENDGWILCKQHCRPIVRDRSRLHSRLQGDARLNHLAIWLWPNSAEYCASSILKGIQSVDVPDEVRLVVGSAPMTSDWEACLEAEDRYLRSLAGDPHVMGAILWYLGGERNREALELVRRSNIPIVFVDRLPPKAFEGDYVGTDNSSCFARGVTHLISLGHRRIGLITNSDRVSTVREREQGYRRALTEAGIEFDPELIYRDPVDELDGVASGLDLLLDRDRPPTAIAGINDQVALQAYESLLARGMSVPGDMSVLGFDGLLRWVPGNGYLTTCMQDFERIGQLATELVIERSRSTTPNSFRHVLLDAPLLCCGSTEKPRPRPNLTCLP